MNFTVTEPDGSTPDLEKIALDEPWAQGLIYCDIDSFVLFADGSLALVDECGNYRCPPEGRFLVVFDK